MRMLVLVCVLGLLGVACASETTEESTTTTSSSGWSKVSDDGAVFGGEGEQRMWRVTAGGPGLVAVGYEEAGEDRNAAAWTSADGSSWTRVAHDEAVFGGGGHQLMWSVTAGGPGVVAVGYDGPTDDLDAAVWTSPDGVSWTQVPHDEAVFGGTGFQLMLDVVAGGPGLVAVGVDNLDAGVWTSADGISWTPIAVDEVIFGGLGVQSMWGLTVGGPGLVAVGYDEGPDDTGAAVWTSADGSSWTRVAHDEAVFGGEEGQGMEGIAVGGPGLVAVGWDGSGGGIDAAVWTSPDGITWTRVPHNESAFGGDGEQSMFGVITGGPGLVAVGWDEAGAPHGNWCLFQRGRDPSMPCQGDAAVWTSVDGSGWSRVPTGVFGGDGDQGIWGVTAGGPGLVAVGGDQSGDDRNAAVWTTGD